MKLNFSKKLVVCLTTALLLASPLTASTTQLPTLGIDKVVEMGINMDEGLLEYTRKIKLYEAKKGDYDNLASIDYQNSKVYIEQYTKAKEYRKDVIKKNMMSNYQNMILSEEQLKLSEVQIELQEKLMKQYDVMLKRGTCDQVTYDKQSQQLKDLKETQEKTKKTLENLKADFLRETNINVDHYTLEPSYTYEEFELKESITAYATDIATQLTKYQKQLAELSDANFWSSIFSSGPEGTAPNYSTYIQGKLNVEEALETVDSNYKSYKSYVEAMYTTTSTSLNDLKIAEAKYKTAQKDLSTLKLKYQLGYVSQLQCEQQKVVVESARISYLQSIYSYNINHFQLEHPWSMAQFRY